MLQSLCTESLDDCQARLDAALERPGRGGGDAAARLRLVALRSLLAEKFISAKELCKQPANDFASSSPADINRSLLSVSGLPVFCLQAPTGTANQDVAALTFYGLASEPHIVAVLLREQQRVLAELHPPTQPDLATLRQQLKLLSNGVDVPISAIVTAACGGEHTAAALLHRSMSSVVSAAADAAGMAAARERRYATLLLIECMRENIADPTTVCFVAAAATFTPAPLAPLSWTLPHS